MRLILVRHGNTFNDGEKVTVVGAHQDPPLTESGRLQAKAFGQRLSRERIEPVAVFCSPLQRTQEFARIALNEAALRLTPVITETLREIDYGLWTGKTEDEIRKEFGEDVWRNWQDDSQWPAGAHWKPEEKDLVSCVERLAHAAAASSAPGQSVVMVGSGGVLRFFLKLPEGEWENRRKKKSFKIQTGRYGELAYDKGKFRCVCWNQQP